MIGIDIGTKNIKVCQLRHEKNGYHVMAALMFSNPLTDNKDDEPLRKKIKTILGESFLLSQPSISSVGGSQILARNFTLPLLSGAELGGAVSLEAKQSISSDLAVMYTDYQALGKIDDNSMDVLFIGVPKEIVERRLQILDDASLSTKIVDIDNFALANCFVTFDANAKEEAVILLDIGCTSTNMTIIDNGMLRFVRNVDFGGKDITAEIAHSFGVTLDVAEKIKLSPDIWNDIGLNIKNVLRKSMPDVFEMVYRSIEYCMSRKRLLNVDRIILTGGTSSLPGVKGFISEVLGIHTENWNPFDHMELPETVKKEYGQFLGVAIGLALREKKHV